MHLWQLKGIQSSKLACERGTRWLPFLLKIGIQKGKGLLDLKAEPSLFHTQNATVERVMKKIQLNLSTTATMGAEESGRCREVLDKSQCMNFSYAGTKKSGRCREVGVSGGSTVSNNFYLGALKIIIFWQFLQVACKVWPNFFKFQSMSVLAMPPF